MTPDNLIGDYKKLPHEVNKRVVKPIVKVMVIFRQFFSLKPEFQPVTKVIPGSRGQSRRKTNKETGKPEEQVELNESKNPPEVDYDPRESIKK